MRAFVAVVLTILVVSPRTRAQDPVWDTLSITLRGNVTTLASYHNVVFVGTDSGEFYRSRDEGQTWEGSDTMFVGAVRSISGADDSIVYLVLRPDLGTALYVSHDSGSHWQQAGQEILAGTYPSRVVSDDRGRIVVCGLWGPGDHEFESALSSTDHGVTWHRGVREFYWWLLLYKGGGSTICLDSSGYCFFSGPEGLSMTLSGSDYLRKTGLDRGYALYANAVDRAQVLYSVVFAYAASDWEQTYSFGVLRSTDHGATWVQRFVPQHIGIATLLVDSLNRLYLCDTAAVRSTDRADTWAPALQGAWGQSSRWTLDALQYAYCASRHSIARTHFPVTHP